MNKKYLTPILIAVLALIWGSSFILMKRGLDAYSHDEVAALRIFISFIFLSPLIFRHIKREMFEHWKAFLGAGLFGNFIPAFLFTKAETVISSTLAGILNSLTPLFTLALGVLFFKTKTKWFNVVGIVVGFVGATSLIIAGQNAEMKGDIACCLLLVIATFCYGLSVNINKRFLQTINPITVSIWAILFIGPPAGIYLFAFTDFTKHVVEAPLAMQSLGYVTILAVFGTALSLILFNILIKTSTAIFASSVTYLIPIVAIGWGVVDGDSMQPVQYMWILLILAGVYLVNKKE